MLLRERRVGKFKVDFYFITDEPEIARLVMKDMIVLRAESLFIEGRILYEATHPAFEVVPMELEIPFYSAIIKAGVVAWNKIEPWEPSRVLVVGKAA